uniref:Protein ALP1-like n=1 Tax=Tanacetum cinerariifolium TaxID=118510 RepID=A0A6L2LNV1_TANCI|nr:hypothetical protein [Tanacetum cinerariifolium]
MRRKLFLKIVKGISTYEVDPLPGHFNFFRVRPDATGRMSLSVIMKCTAAIRQLAYGTTPDAFDEYLQMSANNDINVLDNSSLFDELLNDTAPVVPYLVNGVGYEKGYYLADGIYPQWATFVKSFTVANDAKHAYFKKRQEGARKDVERAFGVLQGHQKMAVFYWNEVYANPARNMQRAWIERAKITTIKESKDLSSLALDKLIGNLKVHEVVMEKDSKIYRGKKERVKSIALKAKKESNDDKTSRSESNDEEYDMAVRNFKSSLEERVNLLGNQEKKRSHSDKEMRRKERVIGNILDAVILIILLAIVQNYLATKIKRPSLEVLGAIAKMTSKKKPTMKLVSWLNRQMR